MRKQLCGELSNREIIVTVAFSFYFYLSDQDLAAMFIYFKLFANRHLTNSGLNQDVNCTKNFYTSQCHQTLQSTAEEITKFEVHQ